MARLTELNEQIEELQEKVDSYEYDINDFEESYKELLNEEGKIVISGITFDPSYVLQELDPVAYREGLLNYADAVYEEGQDQYLNDLQYEIDQLLKELEELTEE